MSEKLQLSGRQVSAARALLGMAQSDLAEAAGVSIATMRRMEASEGPIFGRWQNVEGVRSALEAAGVIFLAENGEGPGVRLRKGVNPGVTPGGQAAVDPKAG